ncbi:hypothetical protein N836_02295 [Leptolyngbya sp. Heron Island J]|nr:hypothetical protein N836_02295 [Leptolyngbya sp. Heron Island J]
MIGGGDVNSAYRTHLRYGNKFTFQSTKAIDNIQATRLDELDARTKNSVHKLRLEHLNNQTKAVENIQSARLEALDARTKAVDNIQEARLDALDSRTKSIR